MKKREDEIAGLFEERLKNWAPEPPQGVWEAVLAAQKRKRRLIIYRISAIAASLLLLVGLPFMLNRSPYQPSTHQTSELRTGTPDAKEGSQAEQAAGTSFDVRLAGSNNKTKLPAPSLKISRPAAGTSPSDNPATPLPSSAEIHLPATIDEALAAAEKPTENQQAVQQAVEEMLAKLKEQDQDVPVVDASALRSKPSVAFGYNFAPATISGENGLFENILNYRYGPDPFQGNMALETSYFKDVQESRLEAPFSAGLRLSYAVSKRLALESGLTYTRLNTYTRTYPLDGIYLEYNQALIYLGLPLGMRYDLWQSRMLTLYTAQNAMVEKGLVAINTINKFEKDRNIGRKRLYENVQGFQLSTTSSVGAGINLHRYVSFYAEGGLQIFYLNHTQPFNIRSSKKLWPVYQTGIRVNFQR